MDDKTISVPIRYYQLLAMLAQQYVEYLTDNPNRTPHEENMFPAFVRWEQWHSAAEERGLTRL